MNLFTGQPERESVTLTATVVGLRGDGWDLDADICDATDRPDRKIRIRVSDSARSAYSLETCVDEVERTINALPAKARLGMAVEMDGWGPFEVVTTPDTGPRVITPKPSAKLLTA